MAFVVVRKYGILTRAKAVVRYGSGMEMKE
jgi:hypothetical protein